MKDHEYFLGHVIQVSRRHTQATQAAPHEREVLFEHFFQSQRSQRRTDAAWACTSGDESVTKFAPPLPFPQKAQPSPTLPRKEKRGRSWAVCPSSKTNVASVRATAPATMKLKNKSASISTKRPASGLMACQIAACFR